MARGGGEGACGVVRRAAGAGHLRSRRRGGGWRRCLGDGAQLFLGEAPLREGGLSREPRP